MIKKQKFELTWVGKENQPKFEPRIPLEKPWRYALIPHDEIAANVTFDALMAKFCR